MYTYRMKTISEYKKEGWIPLEEYAKSEGLTYQGAHYRAKHNESMVVEEKPTIIAVEKKLNMKFVKI